MAQYDPKTGQKVDNFAEERKMYDQALTAERSEGNPEQEMALDAIMQQVDAYNQQFPDKQVELSEVEATEQDTNESEETE